VLLCPTDFEKGRFLFTAVSYGGLSILDDQDVPSGDAAADYLELSGLNGFTAAEVTRLLAGKNLAITPSVNAYDTRLSGSGASRDAETFFQLVNLYFTAPFFTDAAWNRLLADCRTEVQSRKNDPEAVFVDALTAAIYGDSLRHGGVTERYISLLDKEKAAALYRRFFSRPDYFTFVITGDVDAALVRDLAERYLASIPGPKGLALTQRIKDRTLPFPPGKTPVTVRKGLEEQGQAILFFGGQNPPPLTTDTEVERAVVGAMANLVEIRLREVLREQLGGTYGVGASAAVATFPSRRFQSVVQFGMEPKQADVLVEALIAELGVLQRTAASTADMQKVREGFVRDQETARKTSAFWHAALVRHAAMGEVSAAVAGEQAVLSLLTPEVMRRLVGQYFPLDTYVRAVLLPEK
jgi:zinc protease